MKIYEVLTHINLGTWQNNELERQFTKIIKVPFLPYHLEGKRFSLDFSYADAPHKCLSIPGDTFEVKYVIWECNGSTDGSWKMCISGKVSEDVFGFYYKLIEDDILHKIPPLDI